MEQGTMHQATITAEADGQRITATTSQKYTVCFREEHADNTERSE